MAWRRAAQDTLSGGRGGGDAEARGRAERMPLRLAARLGAAPRRRTRRAASDGAATRVAESDETRDGEAVSEKSIFFSRIADPTCHTFSSLWSASTPPPRGANAITPAHTVRQTSAAAR